MGTRDLVLIDSGIWVQFFNRRHSREKQAVDELLDDDRAALIGPILTEVLLGFRRDEQADWVASLLRGLHFLETTWDDWRSAARMGRKLIATGQTLPLSDLVLAAVALRHDSSLYSTDPHFDLIHELKRYTA